MLALHLMLKFCTGTKWRTLRLSSTWFSLSSKIALTFCVHFLLLIESFCGTRTMHQKPVLTYIQCTTSKVVSSWFFFEANVFLVKSPHFARLLSSSNRWRWRDTSIHEVDSNFTLGHTPASLFKSWLDLAALHEGFLKPKMIFVCFVWYHFTYSSLIC